MQVESGFNPNAHNKSSGAHGLMQWLGSRKPKSWSEKDQLDYIAATYNKFGGNEWLDKKAWKRFNETTDPAEAARLFRRYWERPEKSSWYATDKYFGKSYLPQEINNLISQTQDITWQDVQERKKQFELTPEEETLLNTPIQPMHNVEYTDWSNPNVQRSDFAKQFELNSALDIPENRLALLGAFTDLQNSGSQSDNYNWFKTMLSLSPNVSPQ
jgi:hypothetical protein